MYGVGIDLGGTSTKLALVLPDGTIRSTRRVATAAGEDPENAFSKLNTALRDMAATAGLPYPPPFGCGIGIPGVVDHLSGRLVFAGAFGWSDVPVGDIGRKVFGCEVKVDTDVNAGSLADLFLGQGRDSSDMLYISWGTGIGAGLVISRKLYHTRGGAMCNIGHMCADPQSRRLCYCGCRGCLEIEAGGKAMVEQAKERLSQGAQSSLRDVVEITPEAIASAAAANDKLAREILERSAVLMARVLGGVLSLLNPDTVVFGGGVSRCFDAIQNVFDGELQARTPFFSIHLTRIVQSAFGDTAGVLGSAMLVMRHKDLNC